MINRAQGHKGTRAQVHKSTSAQEHKGTRAQVCHPSSVIRHFCTLFAICYSLFLFLFSTFLPFYLLPAVYAFTVRSDGLGGSAVAISDDLGSIRKNPSGLAFIPESQIAFNAGNYVSADKAGPSLGIDYAHFLRKIGVVSGYFKKSFSDDGADMIGVAIGRKERTTENFFWGARIGALAAGLDLNLGARYKKMNYDFGVSAYDIPNENRRVQFGVARKFDEYLICLDFDTKGKLYLGAEAGVYGDMGNLRVGVNSSEKTICLGFGSYLWPYGIDVFYGIPWDFKGTGRFALSLFYRFGGFDFSQILLNKNTEKAVALENKILEMKTRLNVLNKSLVETEDAYKKARDFVDILDSEASSLIKKKLKEHRGDPEPPPKETTIKSPPARAKESKPLWPIKHKVIPGDSLRSLAERYYGNPNRWQSIYDSNRDKIERGLPKIGSELTIPKLP